MFSIIPSAASTKRTAPVGEMVEFIVDYFDEAQQNYTYLLKQKQHIMAKLSKLAPGLRFFQIIFSYLYLLIDNQ